MTADQPVRLLLPSGCTLKVDRAAFWKYRKFLLILVFGAGLGILSFFFEPQLTALGQRLFDRWHAENVYATLFLLSAAGSSLLPGPVWIYVFAAVTLGFPFLASSLAVALGSALGSTSSYIVGRFFGSKAWLARPFNPERLGRWENQSRFWLAAVLFAGSIGALPMDLFYLASGFLRFPAALFLCLIATGRIIHYVTMGYLFYVFRQ